VSAEQRLDRAPNARARGGSELGPSRARVVHRVQDAIITKPERGWDMTALTAVDHATERHLLRLFIDTPACPRCTIFG
jgi:AraC-like DNA-binding protein